MMKWSKKEISELKKKYKNSSMWELAERLCRTERAIESQAGRLGLKKTKKYMKELRAAF